MHVEYRNELNDNMHALCIQIYWHENLKKKKKGNNITWPITFTDTCCPISKACVLQVTITGSTASCKETSFNIEIED